MKNKEPIELSRSEYLFLSEKFEFMSASDAKALPAYIVDAKNDNYGRIVKMAIENELNETEQKYISDRFFNLMNVTQISKKYGVSRQSVYRCLQRAADKLFNCLKYAYCCGFTLINPPENFEEIVSNIKRRNIFCEKYL